MIEYLLDTNTLIALVGKRSDAVLARLDRIKPGAAGTSSIVAHELYFGAYKSQKVAHNLETLRLLFADLVILDFDLEDARPRAKSGLAWRERGRQSGLSTC
ncbi:MAG: PIN domain-containing protein [Asticcacaulis sp.]|nr:PIN domain-containing protein [Asticcacaulis sp.]